MNQGHHRTTILLFWYLQGAEVVHEAPVFYVVEVLFSDDVCVDDLPALDAPDVGLDQAGGGRLQLGRYMQHGQEH